MGFLVTKLKLLRKAATERVAAAFGGKPLQWHLRGLESTVGVGAEAQERATWERSVRKKLNAPTSPSPLNRSRANDMPNRLLDCIRRLAHGGPRCWH